MRLEGGRGRVNPLSWGLFGDLGGFYKMIEQNILTLTSIRAQTTKEVENCCFVLCFVELIQLSFIVC